MTVRRPLVLVSGLPRELPVGDAVSSQNGFRATRNGVNQTCPDRVNTKIVFSTEDFDLQGDYDAANQRWTPAAGPVALSCQVVTTDSISTDGSVVRIYKNGTGGTLVGQALVVQAGTNGAALVEILDNANGTDYYEAFFFPVTVAAGATTRTIDGGTRNSFFFGYLTGGTGPAGPVGAVGPSGGPVPTGGTAGQKISKVDSTDFNVQWVDDRQLLTAPRNYYCRSDGNDLNTGLVDNAGGAFLTVARLIAAMCAIDAGIHQVTGFVRNATTTVPIVLKNFLGALPPILIGDETTPANIAVNVTSNDAITLNGAGFWKVRGFKFTTTTGGVGVAVQSGRMEMQNCEVGNCATWALNPRAYGVIVLTGPHKFSGTSLGNIAQGGFFDAGANTITYAAGSTVNFGGWGATVGGVMVLNSATFSGTFTGSKWFNSSGGIVLAPGSNAEAGIPGSLPGVPFDNTGYPNNLAVNTKTSSYTLALADAWGTITEMDVASANTVTVPPNSTVAFNIGMTMTIVQKGAGQTTVAAGAGVTIRSSGGKLKLAGQWSMATLYKRGTDEWVLGGDIVA